MEQFTPKSNDSEQKIQSILVYFCLFSEPKLGRGKVWQVLNSFQFGKDFRIDGKKVKGPSRKIFSQTKDELLKRKLICEIKGIRDRGNFFSITPLGLCSLVYKTEHVEDVIKILETFATKSTPPYKSHIFRNEKINFKNFTNDLIDKDKITKEDLFYLLFEIIDSIKISNNIILISLYLRSRGGFEVRMAQIDLVDNKIRLFEHSSPQYSRHIELTDIQFHQYLSKLLLSLFVYSNSFNEHGSSIDFLESTKSEGKKPNFTDILPTLLDNKTFTQITFMIHRAVKTTFEFTRKDIDYFSNTLDKVQFEV